MRGGLFHLPPTNLKTKDMKAEETFNPTKIKVITEELLNKLNKKLNNYINTKSPNSEVIKDARKTIEMVAEINNLCTLSPRQDIWNELDSIIDDMREVDSQFDSAIINIRLGERADKPAYINLTM